jgi:hypothetical protein
LSVKDANLKLRRRNKMVKKTEKRGMDGIFVTYLVVTMIISILYGVWSSVKACGPNCNQTFTALYVSFLIVILSALSFLGLIKHKQWGRVLGIIISLVLALLYVCIFILNVFLRIFALPLAIFYGYVFFYLLLSKKVKEAFK